uniref:hypothetical protein n=1 Tax=uncultured Sphingomonas sp. TaxID=158754 RepID=UPI0035CB98F2
MTPDVIARVEARCSRSGIPITCAGIEAIAAYLDEEGARYCDADALVGGGEARRFHTTGDTL